ncbi:MAG: glycosyltransferase [Actinomycetota bacterium]
MNEVHSVSVVIPAFNEEEWVAVAIESALHQDPAPVEVIVVDDGSTDGTADVAARHEGVTVVAQHNQGLAGARNTGASRAKGESIMFLDADDELEPGALQAFTRAAVDNPGCGAVISNYVKVRPGGADAAWPRAAASRVIDRSDVAGLVRKNWLQANALVRAEIWRRFPYREGMLKDLDLWLRMLFEGVPIVVLGRPLVRVTAGRPQALTSRTALMRANRRRTFNWVWDRNDLTSVERGLVAYQLARTSAGEVVARAGEDGAVDKVAVQSLGADDNPVVRWTMRAMSLPGALSLAVRLDRGPRRT